jgi:hypothetical protein
MAAEILAIFLGEIEAYSRKMVGKSAQAICFKIFNYINYILKNE